MKMLRVRQTTKTGLAGMLVVVAFSTALLANTNSARDNQTANAEWNIPYTPSAEDQARAAVMESVVKDMRALDVNGLLAILDRLATSEVDIPYTQVIFAYRSQSTNSMFTPGSMTHICETMFEKGGSFSQFSTGAWREALQKMMAFSGLLFKDPSKAIGWLANRGEHAEPTLLDALYGATITFARRNSAAEWPWPSTSSADWMRLLKGRNPLLRSLALDFSEHFATPEDIAQCCSDNMDMRWPYLHRQAIEKAGKLNPADGKKLLERYLNSDKPAMAGDQADRMRKKAEETLTQLQSPDSQK